MTSRLIRTLAPPAAAIIGAGIGYLSAGSGTAARTESTAATTAVQSDSAHRALEIPYAATMDGVIRATAENTSARREWLLDSLTAKMTVAELEATAARIESLVRDEQYVLLPRVIAAWAALDAEGAERWLIQHAPTFRKGASTFLVTLEAYAKKQPIRAFAILDKLPAGERREKLAAAAAMELAKLSPHRATELAHAVQDEKARKLAEVGVLSGLAHADPLAALARVNEMPAEERESLVETALDGVFARDATSGFLELAKLPAQEQKEHIHTLAWKYADQAPQAFADYVTKNAGPKAGTKKSPRLPPDDFTFVDTDSEDFSHISDVASYAASAMAEKNPSGAIEWAQNLPETARDSAISGALGIWSQKDPVAAMAWALKNKPEVKPTESDENAASYQRMAIFAGGFYSSRDEGNSNIRTILNEWSSRDSAAVLAWSKTAEGSPYRQEVASVLLAPVIAEGSVEEARELLGQLSPERQKSAVWSAIGSISRSNPAKAAEWLTTLPVEEHSSTLYDQVVRYWSRTDISAAAAWIEQLPKSPARDSAALSYAQQIANADPSAAMEWALGTTTGDERSSAMATIYYQWQRKQPDAAADWLKNVQGLTEEEKERFGTSDE